jgi:hypothetical protein
MSPELAARIKAEPEPVAPALLEQARSLYADLRVDAELEPDRRTWLSAQLAGIVTAIEQLAGEQRSYTELVQRCHGVRTALAPEEQFAAAHRRLDDALPGHGDVRERYRAWALTQRVQGQLLLPGLTRLADELGRRTRERFDLPGGDGVTFELVTGKRWAGNAAFLGGGHTRIGINRDLPIASFRLVELVVHEAFPGHHTEAVCKERLGRPELDIFVYPTPQALIAEGIAMLAEALLGEETEAVGAECLRPLGIPYDTEVAAVVRQAQLALLPVPANLALLFGEHRISGAQAREYARRWLLEDDAYVERVVHSVETRPWPAYEACYPEGLALCRRFTDGDPARFRRLLCEQLTPASMLE